MSKSTQPGHALESRPQGTAQVVQHGSCRAPVQQLLAAAGLAAAAGACRAPVQQVQQGTSSAPAAAGLTAPVAARHTAAAEATGHLEQLPGTDATRMAEQMNRHQNSEHDESKHSESFVAYQQERFVRPGLCPKSC